MLVTAMITVIEIHVNNNPLTTKNENELIERKAYYKILKTLTPCFAMSKNNEIVADEQISDQGNDEAGLVSEVDSEGH